MAANMILMRKGCGCLMNLSDKVDRLSVITEEDIRERFGWEINHGNVDAFIEFCDALGEMEKSMTSWRINKDDPQ